MATAATSCTTWWFRPDDRRRAVRGIRKEGVRARGHLPHGGVHRGRLAHRARLLAALALDGALRAKYRSDESAPSLDDHLRDRGAAHVAHLGSRRHAADS